MIINDADLCEDNGHVNEFSTIVNNDLTRLDETEFQMPHNELGYF